MPSEGKIRKNLSNAIRQEILRPHIENSIAHKLQCLEISFWECKKPYCPKNSYQSNLNLETFSHQREGRNYQIKLLNLLCFTEFHP